MNAEEATRTIAREVPRELKRLRGRLMLDELADSLGTAETVCPACRGTGWLNAGRMEDCPICLGFRDVPAGLADWFSDRLGAALCGRRPVSLRTRPSGLALPPRVPSADERPFLRPLKCHISLND
jgi:hypothetical protein